MPVTAMVQANEDVMSRPPECDSRPSTSGSGPLIQGKPGVTRWPGGARPKIFSNRSFSTGSRPSVLSRASGSLISGTPSRPSSRFGSRGSLISGSIATADEIGSGVSRLRRELPSISDICGHDEIQELLRDIETLECRRWNSDWETFTIQSSHPDLDTSQDFELYGQELESLSRCDSRLSWDSHMGRMPNDDGSRTPSDGSLSPRRGVPRGPIATLSLAWDDSHLKTSVGIFRLLLLVMSVITMTCACTVGTARLSIFVLPGVWRLRVMMFTTVFTILTTLILIGLHLTSVVHSLTLRWDRVVTVTYCFICLCYLVSAVLLLYLLHLFHTTYQWIPEWSKKQLLTTSLCGLVCGVVALVLTVLSGHGFPRYGRVLSESSTAETTSFHQLHNLNQITSSVSGIPLTASSRILRGSSGTSLGHSGIPSTYATTTFTPDSLEPQPGPSKSLPQNHISTYKPPLHTSSGAYQPLIPVHHNPV